MTPELEESIRRFTEAYYKFRGYLVELTDYPQKERESKWEGLDNFDDLESDIWFQVQMMVCELNTMESKVRDDPESDKLRIVYHRYLSTFHYTVTGLLVRAIRESKGYDSEENGCRDKHKAT